MFEYWAVHVKEEDVEDDSEDEDDDHEDGGEVDEVRAHHEGHDDEVPDPREETQRVDVHHEPEDIHGEDCATNIVTEQQQNEYNNSMRDSCYIS